MTKFYVIALCVSLAACFNQKKDQEGREPASSAPPAAAPAAPGTASGSTAPGSGAPVGTQAAEANAAGGAGATTPTPEACATPSPLHCDAGQVDGCSNGLTSVHACVAGDAKAGGPCAQGPALTCTTGQVDACSFKPPYASTHICVVVPRPTP